MWENKVVEPHSLGCTMNNCSLDLEPTKLLLTCKFLPKAEFLDLPVPIRTRFLGSAGNGQN